jgi:hypothetical protein
MWVAATCQPATRRLFIDALAGWINSTSTDNAMSDLYDTARGWYPVDDRGGSIQFVARPVQAVCLVCLALERAGGNGTVLG